jgi:hypothetical protein
MRINITPGYGALPAKDKVAEILVLGKQQSHLARREHDNIRVAQARCSFRDIEYVVSISAQKRNQSRRDTFVSEPAHT